jgi:hypothetical protein
MRAHSTAVWCLCAPALLLSAVGCRLSDNPDPKPPAVNLPLVERLLSSDEGSFCEPARGQAGTAQPESGHGGPVPTESVVCVNTQKPA